MEQIRIVHFTKGDDEYVVMLSDLDDCVSDYARPGFVVATNVVASLTSSGVLPLDRELEVTKL